MLIPRMLEAFIGRPGFRKERRSRPHHRNDLTKRTLSDIARDEARGDGATLLATPALGLLPPSIYAAPQFEKRQALSPAKIAPNPLQHRTSRHCMPALRA
jgi:hypothetical protein